MNFEIWKFEYGYKQHMRKIYHVFDGVVRHGQ